MELINGHSLREELRSAESTSHQPNYLPDIGRSLDILFKIASALDFAHGKGIIHCDVKPGNILLSRDGQVKVADFGIARDARVGSSQNTGAGTIFYMAPEQLIGKVDARSDQYSLGIVAREMLLIDVEERPWKLRPWYLDIEDPELIWWLDDIESVISKATDEKPVCRFASCSEFIRCLGVASQKHVLDILRDSADLTLDFFEKTRDQRGFYISPSIPKTILKKACQLSCVSETESVLAVAVLSDRFNYTLSLFQYCSMKSTLVFTKRSIRFGDEKLGGSSEISYADFADATFRGTFRLVYRSRGDIHYYRGCDITDYHDSEEDNLIHYEDHDDGISYHHDYNDTCDEYYDFCDLAEGLRGELQEADKLRSVKFLRKELLITSQECGVQIAILVGTAYSLASWEVRDESIVCSTKRLLKILQQIRKFARLGALQTDKGNVP